MLQVKGRCMDLNSLSLQHLLREVLLGEAGRDDELCEGDGTAKFDEGNVVVEGPRLVVLMDQNRIHVVDGLAFLLFLGVKLT